MNTDRIPSNSSPSQKEVEFTPLVQKLSNAISAGDESTIGRLLSNEKIPSDMLVQPLIEAQKQNLTKTVKHILNHPAFNADMRNHLFSAAVDLYDNNGDNFALLLAEQLSDPSIKKETMANIEKTLSEKANVLFKKNLEKQLNMIRDTLQRVISRKERVIPSTHHAETVLAHINIVKETFSDKRELRVAFAGSANDDLTKICKRLADTKEVKRVSEGIKAGVDVVLAPHTLYSEMEAIFSASEALLSTNPPSLEEHPLSKYFDMLDKKGIFVATFKSGPTIQDFTELLLGKHGLELAKANRTKDVNLKIFKNVETFLRCLDIYKKKYEERTGLTIDCEISHSLLHTPLEPFCKGYIEQYPELADMDSATREKFVRLLSVFNIKDEILDLDITLKMSIKEKDPLQSRSFKPIPASATTFQREQKGSNELSVGQQNLDKQIQTLTGSALSMVDIKDADGKAQLKALSRLFTRKEVKVVDLGGGYGETNAVLQALQQAGPVVDLLNIEPCTKDNCTQSYKEAHQAVGITKVDVKVQNAQMVTVASVIDHFQNQHADCVFASHFFYGLLMGEFYKASHSSLPLNQYSFWKYLQMMHEDSVLAMTLQSGSGARLIRNALVGNHGLNQPSSSVTDETLSLLSSFGNLATFLRHFEFFKEQYQKETNRTVTIKMHAAVANVSLGDFKIEQDSETGGYLLENPKGDKTDKNWLSPIMLDFYGNWFELELLATLTTERAQKIITRWKECQTYPELKLTDEYKVIDRQYKILEAKGLLNPTPEALIANRKSAKEMQEAYLHILRVFAPGEKNMQHPNITLEISQSLRKAS